MNSPLSFSDKPPPNDTVHTNTPEQPTSQTVSLPGCHAIDLPSSYLKPKMWPLLLPIVIPLLFVIIITMFAGVLLLHQFPIWKPDYTASDQYGMQTTQMASSSLQARDIPYWWQFSHISSEYTAKSAIFEYQTPPQYGLPVSQAAFFHDVPQNFSDSYSIAPESVQNSLNRS